MDLEEDPAAAPVVMASRVTAPDTRVVCRSFSKTGAPKAFKALGKYTTGGLPFYTSRLPAYPGRSVFPGCVWF
ncbi:MAG: hypothetical protein KJ002_13885, partial [Candidatus Dadabacteria bacterium]|nr:hypothetical protein [Candidatus Dadabacteria bacterium]